MISANEARTPWAPPVGRIHLASAAERTRTVSCASLGLRTPPKYTLTNHKADHRRDRYAPSYGQKKLRRDPRIVPPGTPPDRPPPTAPASPWSGARRHPPPSPNPRHLRIFVFAVNSLRCFLKHFVHMDGYGFVVLPSAVRAALMFGVRGDELLHGVTSKQFAQANLSPASCQPPSSISICRFFQ